MSEMNEQEESKYNQRITERQEKHLVLKVKRAHQNPRHHQSTMKQSRLFQVYKRAQAQDKLQATSSLIEHSTEELMQSRELKEEELSSFLFVHLQLQSSIINMHTLDIKNTCDKFEYFCSYVETCRKHRIKQGMAS